MKTFDSSKGGLTLLHPKQLLTAVAVAGALTLTGCATTPVATTVDTGSFSVPTYQQITLANGLTVYLMPQREVPLITVNATVRAY